MNVSQSVRRFAAVGIINTTVDAGLFTSLHLAGLPTFRANLISTTVGLCVSLVLNSRYTFGGTAVTKRLIGRFLSVTLIGLWALQPVLIHLFSRLDSALQISASLASYSGHSAVLASLLPKLAAIACTLIWNYLWYSRFVYA